MRILIAIVTSGICSWAQAGLERPPLGMMLDSSGAVRPIQGLAGSLTVGNATVTGVLSTACSAKLCLAKTESGIWWASGTAPAPPGPAIFALDGDAALIYFPGSRQFARWKEGQLDFLSLDIPGEILSLRRGKEDTIELVVRQRDGVQIVRAGLKDRSLSTVSSLPEGTRVAMLLADGVLYLESDTVILQRTDGSETQFQASGVEAAFALGEGYVELRAGASIYAVRVERGREQIFLLPGAQ